MIIDTYDPIISEVAYKRSLFPRIPIPGASRNIILYSTDTRRKLLISHDAEVKPTDIRRGRFDKEIEIDMRQHPICFKQNYRCYDGKNDFEVQIRATANVYDPEFIWEKDIRNVTEAVLNEIETSIQDLASERELMEWKYLQDEIKAAFRDEVQLLCGVAIKGVNVTVRMDEEIEKIYKKENKERFLKESAEKLKELYRNEDDAIFAQLADGKITAQEALKLKKEVKNEDFNDKMQKLREVMDIAQKLKDSDLVGNERIEQYLEGFLQQSEKSGTGNRRIEGSGTEQKKLTGNDDVYREFD